MVKKESNPIVMFFKRRAVRIVGIIGLSFVILYASVFTAIFLDSTLKNPEQIKFVTDPVAMKQCISNNEQIRMFTIFFFVILLLGIITLLVGGKSSFKVDMIEITPEIHTPVPVGQGQHGTAKWLNKKDFDKVFDSVIIDSKKLMEGKEHIPAGGLVIGKEDIKKSFFSRKIKQGKRPIDMEENHLIAPCDGLLSVWKIKENTVFPVKQSHYTISSLLHSKKLAQRYHGGYCLVYRLCVNHYHRYCYVDSGQKSRNFFIPGRLHTVRPVALREVPVFTENSREYTLIRTEKFGTVVQMEVGAMLVGRIVNHEEKGSTIRGKEKGYFQYGGSTIIVLIEPEQVQIREDILQSSALTKEVPVKMGEVIGHALEHKRTIQ